MEQRDRIGFGTISGYTIINRANLNMLHIYRGTSDTGEVTIFKKTCTKVKEPQARLELATC
jgi:hypothetical protein